VEGEKRLETNAVLQSIPLDMLPYKNLRRSWGEKRGRGPPVKKNRDAGDGSRQELPGGGPGKFSASARRSADEGEKGKVSEGNARSLF